MVCQASTSVSVSYHFILRTWTLHMNQEDHAQTQGSDYITVRLPNRCHHGICDKGCGAELPQKHWTTKHLQSGLAQVSTTAYQTDSCDDVILTDAVHLIFMGSSSGWQRGTSWHNVEHFWWPIHSRCTLVRVKCSGKHWTWQDKNQE